MKTLTTFLRRVADCIYVIRDTRDAEPQLALTRRGYLSALKYAGPDASVHTLSGRWIAGRCLGA